MSEPDDDTFLTSAQVRKRYGGVSRMWLWDRVNNEKKYGFPKPIKMGTQRLYWRLGDLRAYERACVTAKDHSSEKFAQTKIKSEKDAINEGAEKELGSRGANTRAHAHKGEGSPNQQEPAKYRSADSP